MVITTAHISPIMSLIAGVLILIMPRLSQSDGRDLSDPQRPDRSRPVQMAPYLALTGVRSLRGTAQNGVRRALPPLSRIVCKSWPKPHRSSKKPQRNQSHPWSARAKAAPPASARKVLKKSPAKTVAKVAAAASQLWMRAKSGKWVFTFGDGKAEGKAELRDLLGGKGANLAEMANLGLPVPPGFTIPTSVCTYFYAHDKSYPKELKAQVEKALDHVGKLTGKTFGDSEESAAGVGALRRPRLDAGHDGHRAQSRPQRQDRRGAGAKCPATAASPMTAIAASSRCIPTWCSASSMLTSRTSSTPSRTARAIRSTPT